MSKTNLPKSDDEPNVSSTALFIGLSVVLILVALILTIGDAVKTTAINFGNCRMKTEIAITGEQKALGLSGRSSIDNDEAMLFPFIDEQPVFWMKDMLFPIDIIWVDGKKVIEINAAAPADDGAASYPAPGPIDWVIEVGNGRAKACGVKKGTEIRGLRT